MTSAVLSAFPPARDPFPERLARGLLEEYLVNGHLLSESRIDLIRLVRVSASIERPGTVGFEFSHPTGLYLALVDSARRDKTVVLRRICLNSLPVLATHTLDGPCIVEDPPPDIWPRAALAADQV